MRALLWVLSVSAIATEAVAQDVTFQPAVGLGVQVLDMTPALRRFFGGPEAFGVLVASVDEDGPAARAGIRAGDVLLSVDGGRVGSNVELVARMLSMRPGDEVLAAVLRDRRIRTVRVTFEEATATQAAPTREPPDDRTEERLRNLETRVDRLESGEPQQLRAAGGSSWGVGTIRIGSVGGFCSVTVDGTPIGNTPIASRNVAGGRHVVRCVGSGFDQTKTVVVRGGQMTVVRFSR